MMHCFRYKLEHDYGFAPNPFGGTLSLATCRGPLRKNKNLSIGDWVIGLGSVAMGNLNRMIFAMKVEEKLTFDRYWSDSRFLHKRPVLNGTLVQMYGDNVYHTDFKTNKMIQEKCAHSQKDGSVDKSHYRRDIDGRYVLLSTHFYYFGAGCIEIPVEFGYIYDVGRGPKYKDLDEKKIKPFIEWLETNYATGIHGEPCNWKEFDIPDLNIYDDGLR